MPLTIGKNENHYSACYNFRIIKLIEIFYILLLISQVMKKIDSPADSSFILRMLYIPCIIQTLKIVLWNSPKSFLSLK